MNDLISLVCVQSPMMSTGEVFWSSTIVQPLLSGYLANLAIDNDSSHLEHSGADSCLAINPPARFMIDSSWAYGVVQLPTMKPRHRGTVARIS